MIFDLNPESAGFNINRKETHEGLFGFLKTMNLDDETAKLLREIRQTADTRSDRIDVKPIKNGPSGFTVTEKVITEKDVDKMTKHDREVLWNKLIDNGVENLTEQDKLVLGYLAKY
jgi:hypothetical protein